jgi:hypothetical protein
VYGRGYRFVAATSPAAGVSGADAPPSAPAPADTELDAVVVGRASELQTLSEAWRRASAGQRQVVFVIGEPGMGKTTLTDAFVRRLAVGDSGSAPSLIAHGQCVEQHGAGEPFLPVIEALERLCAASGSGPVLELLRRHDAVGERRATGAPRARGMRGAERGSASPTGSACCARWRRSSRRCRHR